MVVSVERVVVVGAGRREAEFGEAVAFGKRRLAEFRVARSGGFTSFRPRPP